MSTATMSPPTTNPTLLKWVDQMADLCKPDRIHWCDGTDREADELTRQAVEAGEVERLDAERWPGCLYARSNPNDVARVEELTFICTPSKRDAGPTNNWMSPEEAYAKLASIYRGSMKGRTMYVIPFIMGVPGSPFQKIGFELTDSVYVVLNMRIMTRIGRAAIDQLGSSPDFTRGLHGKADVDPKRRYICHFPEDNTIWSVGTNYGGNVLLGKKCLALRLGSWLGRREGWLAEHMLIVGIQSPKGPIRYVAAAFPSQCGKTNLAMLVPPKSMPGYRIWTVGDDIAWMRIGPDGRLWAVNPEAGFFGVAPGTNSKTNPNAMETARRNTIFTNVLKTPSGDVWWEGMDGQPPASGTNWKGQPWTPASPEKGAHPNSRFTAPAAQCPSISPEWQNPAGVPISAIIFGGRRAAVAPLVYEAFDWNHGVYVGATMASETTAAQQGQTVGVVRRDPMAMLPFCGYHMGDYFAHWIEMGRRLARPPKIFHVNWFRRGPDGTFVWPGYGENLRVLDWIVRRSEETVGARTTPIGCVPNARDLQLDGTGLSAGQVERDLLSIATSQWLADANDQEAFFDKFGADLPQGIRVEKDKLLRRLREESA